MADYLFELGCEELPATKIHDLREQLHRHWCNLLGQHRIAYQQVTCYATPRRLVLLTTGMGDTQQDQQQLKLGPWHEQAFDATGTATKAALGFARSCAVDISELESREEDGRTRLAYVIEQHGEPVTAIIPEMIPQLFKQLHLPQSMRWGSRRETFMRPVRWLCSVLGNSHLPVQLFGLDSNQKSYGHRFLHPQAVVINTAQDYAQQLQQVAVIVDQQERQQSIVSGIATLAEAKGLQACYSDSLLEELTYLVESPFPVLCSFDRQFLELPNEVLIATMVKHQKYVYTTNSDGDIEPFFITISNIPDAQGQVQAGNERVLRPRMSDAQFFLAQDQQIGLDTMAQGLDDVVFEASLGSMALRSQRIATLATALAKYCAVDPAKIAQSAALCKADLVSLMVGEFAELQGVMGRYYAAEVGYSATVAQAIEEHYLPRFSGDSLPESQTGLLLALSDRLDLLTGFFVLGKKPTSDKDPYGLRRAALAVIRIAVTMDGLPELSQLVILAAQSYQKDAPEDLPTFFLERLRFWYSEQGISAQVFAAVAAVRVDNLADFDRRVSALHAMPDQHTVTVLAGLTKRIGNIIGDVPAGKIDTALFEAEQESGLYRVMQDLEPALQAALVRGDYGEYLNILTGFEQPIDAFFDKVMVRSDNPDLAANRIALVSHLYALCTGIIDISKLG